jgi:hypothetical protein
MKTKFNLLILLGLILILVGDTLGQTTYYSAGSEKPELLGNWKTARDGSGNSPSNFTSGDIFVIQNGHTMTNTAVWEVSGDNSKVQIENGGTLQSYYAITLSSSTTFQIDNGGTYIHNNTGAYASTILQAGTRTFGESSHFIIKLSESSMGDILSTTFGNMEINFSSSQSSDVNFNAEVTTLQGDLKITSTNGKKFALTNNQKGLILNIEGSIIINGGTFYFADGNSTTYKTYIMNISKNYTQTGGTFGHNNNFSDARLLIVFKGDGYSYTKSSGTLESDYINWELNIAGTFTLNSDFTLISQRSFTLTNGTFTIASGKSFTINGYLDCKSSVVNGSGHFFINDNATLVTKNINGIRETDASGAIQVTGTRKFYDGVNYIFNGTSEQIIGDAFTQCNDITIDNSAGVKLGNSFLVSGTLYMTNGNLDRDGNTLLYANNATLNYNGTTSRTTTNAELPSSGGPKNIIITNNEGVTLHASRTISYSVLVNGIFDMSSYIISGGADFSVYGTIKTTNSSGISGCITTTGTNYYSTTAKYVFYGSAINQVSGHSFSECRSIQILNSNGVTLSNNITLTQNLDVSGGKLILGDKNLTVGADATITGYGSSYYVNTNSTGLMFRYCKTNADAIFPIGNSAYNPATVRITGGDTGYFSATVKDSYTNNPPDPTKCVTREWNVSNITGGSPTVTLKFQFNTGEYGANFQPAGDIVVGHYSGGVWTELPATISGGEASYLVEAGSISGFSYFTIGNQGAMPVELMAFSGNAVGNQVKLSWSTSSEINNKGFDIERQFSSNGNSYSEWSKVGFIQGNGNSTGIINYNFTDKCTETGKYKYRLKQIDYNGNFEYHNLSTLIDVGSPKKFEISQNYPNPFNPTTKIDFTIPKDANVLIAIFDITGKEVLKVVNENMKAGYYTKDLNLSNQSSGVYFYRIISTAGSEKFVDTKKMVLLK